MIKTYIPPIWFYNNILVAHKATGIEFVVHSIRLGPSKEESFATLTMSGSGKSNEDIKLSIPQIIADYDKTGKRCYRF